MCLAFTCQNRKNDCNNKSRNNLHDLKPNYNLNLVVITDFHVRGCITQEKKIGQVTMDLLSCSVKGFRIEIFSRSVRIVMVLFPLASEQPDLVT